MVNDWNKFNGMGMTSARTRARMIARLREQGIKDEVVLSAMNAVPRHIFVEEGLAIRAYEDTPLPIGQGQTISQPWVVARMSELARNGKPLRDVLEVGTGSGYQTAILAQIAERVFTIERIGLLVAQARRRLRDLKLTNVAISHGDAAAGFPESLKFDVILITAGATVLPPVLLDYLKVGGRMVLPLIDERGELINGELPQRLTVVERAETGFYTHAYEPVRFVPLLPGIA
jgi:protein-L-isoaspartate(D-aspartate) O-methyltransferase